MHRTMMYSTDAKRTDTCINHFHHSLCYRVLEKAKSVSFWQSRPCADVVWTPGWRSQYFWRKNVCTHNLSCTMMNVLQPSRHGDDILANIGPGNGLLPDDKYIIWINPVNWIMKKNLRNMFQNLSFNIMHSNICLHNSRHFVHTIMCSDGEYQ